MFARIQANINAVCKDGCSPLMYASAQGFCGKLHYRTHNFGACA
jgi:hypothetical protein